MQFVSFFTPANPQPPGTMPDPKHMEEMGKLMTEWMAKGVLVATGGIGRAANGVHITASNGDFKTRDGADHAVVPSVNGFAILQGNTKEDIVEAAKAFLKVAGDGTVDLIPLLGPPPQK
ncbi:MAG TPA: hypothetical protein VIM56_10180 [Rhizomicrobium sp.]